MASAAPAEAYLRVTPSGARERQPPFRHEHDNLLVADLLRASETLAGAAPFAEVLLHRLGRDRGGDFFFYGHNHIGGRLVVIQPFATYNAMSSRLDLERLAPRLLMKLRRVQEPLTASGRAKHAPLSRKSEEEAGCGRQVLGARKFMQKRLPGTWPEQTPRRIRG